MATAPYFDGTQPCLKAEDIDIFFPELPDHPTNEDRALHAKTVLEAKAVCNTCPFIEPCLAYAVKTPNTYGIWGATTEDERARVKRQISKQKHLAKKKGTP